MPRERAQRDARCAAAAAGCLAAHPAQPHVLLLRRGLVGQHARDVLLDANDHAGRVGVQLHQVVQLVLAAQRLHACEEGV